MLWIAALLAVGNIAAAFYFGHLLRAQAEEARAERADLLNRIMARDYAEYAALARDRPAVEVQPFLTDEEEAKLERGEL